MGSKRRWSTWPRRILHELNGVSGIATVGGTVISLASWSLWAGPAASAFIIGGSIVSGLASVYAVVRAIPGPVRRAEDMVGNTITLTQLSDIVPPVQTLAIIGPTQAGKSTLRNRLSFGTGRGRTQQVTAHIVSLQTAPPKCVAVLDGAGDSYAQQFKIAKLCDLLCVVVDHNSSDSDRVVNRERLAAHSEFLSQIRHYLDQELAGEKKWIHFLFNKRDLWMAATEEQQSEFESFCEAELHHWQDVQRAAKLDYATHSNDIPTDIAKYMDRLKDKA